MIKEIKLVKYEQVRKEATITIKKVVHGLPTWMFPNFMNRVPDLNCAVCHQEMGMTIAHGQHITTCSFVQCDDGLNYPIHTACYNIIGTEKNQWDVNHFEQSQNVFDEINIDYYNPAKQ